MYLEYLSANSKQEVYRVEVPFTNPAGLKDYISKITSEKWRWLGIPNNCYSFVEEVLDSAGAIGSYHKTFNCPLN